MPTSRRNRPRASFIDERGDNMSMLKMLEAAIAAAPTTRPPDAPAPQTVMMTARPRRAPARVVEPPSTHLFPNNGCWAFTHSVSKEALEAVEGISAAALELGWTSAELYQNRGRYAFPFGGDYGLVCFLEPDWRVGMVTRAGIEVITRHGNRQCFRRRGA